jgi:hypothetical protein
VRWTINSTPKGAFVRAASGERLGQTPWSRTQPAAPGPVQLTLELDGCVPRQLVLRGDADEELDEHLDPLARPRAHRSSDQPGGSYDEVVVH